MIKKLLIANRGEIAVRIIRACAELNIRSVAIYTDVDKYALHVKQANEAYCIGPESVADYLNVYRIVNVAASSGCDAIHPGYGFLSENPELARACKQRDIIFVGPSAEVIETMGDKTAARELMQAAEIPILPGSDGAVPDLDAALAVAETIKYPVMLKASGGGGGRGIRLCESADDIKQQFPRVVSEAQKAFSNPDIFVEKYIAKPRHIEVQILADKYGNCIHLYERDCSIQRRHQKLIEIAPSPQLDATQRAKVCALAVKAASFAKYENAGTIEFLLDQSGEFYFLEMNTRLQVEHTVTEQITGVDIVQEQIHIAAGKPLQYQQDDITMRGIALDFRVNAEDPRHDFLPAFGRITRYYAPGGPGVRTDSAIYTGYTIPPDYDSMCAKLTVWALTWGEALRRSRRALQEMKLYGIKTTIPYYLEILEHPKFLNAEFDTHFIEQHPELLHFTQRKSTHNRVAIIATALCAYLESLEHEQG